MMVHHLQLVIWKLRFNNKQKGYLYSISGRNYFTMHLRDIYISMLSFFRLETGENSELQIRVQWGTIAITLFFIVYYISMLIWVIKFYKYEDRSNKILKISLFAVLGFMSSIVGYFL